jgi:uncharacterized protein YebE (UPF0316 family)
MFESELAGIILLSAFIFFARVLDVALGTIRIIFISKGFKWLVPVIGFFEVLIWIIAIGEIMDNLNNWIYYVFYAGGFAMGNYVGMVIEERLAIGYEMVRVITKRDAYELIEKINDEKFGLTHVRAHGSKGKVAVLYVIVKRTNLSCLLDIIKAYNPKAFYTIEEIRYVNDVNLQTSNPIKKRIMARLLKGKH